jgi:multiple sugar transport system permease protein
MKRILMSVRDGRGFDIVLVAFPLGFLFLMAGLPLIYNVVMSFQEVDMFSLGTFSRPFVGFKNYTDLFAQPETLPILYNTVIFVVGSIAGQFLIGFGLALFFWVNFPGASWMRGLFLVSWVMPGLVVGAIWNWILSGDFGVLNFILKESGIISGNIFWRSDPQYSLYAVIIANVWLGTSFNMILLSVGLAGIPADLYEAAELDGANVWQRFWNVTLPGIMPVIIVTTLLSSIWTANGFEHVWLLTAGGPSDATMVFPVLAFFGMQTQRIGEAAAVSVYMLPVMAILVLFATSLMMRKED